MRASYKPKENELILHEPIQILKNSLFKGVPCKILRISGTLLKDVDSFLMSQDPNNFTNRDREVGAEKILKSFFALTEKQIDSKKRRYYKTGIRFGQSQLLITEFVYPVPHIKNLAIVLVTLDLYDMKSKDYWMKSSFWSLNYDDVMSEELQEYYTENVNMAPREGDEDLEAMLTRLIFDITPPKLMAA